MAAFILALITVLLGIIMFALVATVAAKAGGRPEAIKHGIAALGPILALALLTDLTSMGLSIASLFFAKTKRIFGGVGLGISGVVMVLFAGLVMIGIAQSHKPQGLTATPTPPSVEAPEPLLGEPASEVSSVPALPKHSWEGLPVYQIAINDTVTVTITAGEGVRVGGQALARLRDGIDRRITDKKADNQSEALAKQFIVAVNVTKYGTPVPKFDGYRYLTLAVDVRVLPGMERVTYFNAEEIGGPELSDELLEQKAAADAIKCLADPRMWIRPVKVGPLPVGHRSVAARVGSDTDN